MSTDARVAPSAMSPVRAARVADVPPAAPRVPAGLRLAVGDFVVCLAVCVGAAFAATGGVVSPAAPVLALFLLVALSTAGLYARAEARLTGTTLRAAGRVVGAAATGTWVYVAATAYVGGLRLPVGAAAAVSFVAPLAVLAARAAMRRVGSSRRVTPTLVIGARGVGRSLAATLAAARGGAHVVGLVKAGCPAWPGEGSPGAPVFPLAGLENELETTGARRAVIVGSDLSARQALGALRTCAAWGLEVDLAPRFHEFFANEVRLDSVGCVPLVKVDRKASPLDEAAKRVLDVVVSALLLVLLAPVLFLAAAVVRLGSRGPVLFRHSRVGLHEEVFGMLKFRTMDVGACDWAGEEAAPPSRSVEEKQRDDPRVTRSGRLLRTTSIDELPQLWNVLRGDMSLVGPRPLPVSEYVARGAPGGVRLTVRPGLTGPWQVLGRSEIPFSQRMVLDEQYARNRTLGLDLRLLMRTIPAVVSRRGAY